MATDFTNTSLSYSRAYDETQQELRKNLPPWKQAGFTQRIFITLLYIGIWFPVIVLVSLIAGGYSIYVSLYIYPLIADVDDRPEIFYWHSQSQQKSARIRGCIFLVLITWSAFWFYVSHFRAMTTPPGQIPQTKDWDIPSQQSSGSSDNSQDKQREKRKDGSKRTCSRCQKRKPDRSHHCKQCERCNLKMDHHCNWIANCVGFFNYKYFFLMVFYGSIMLGIFIGSFWECVVVTLNDSESPTILSFVVVLSYSLLLMLGIAVIGFCFFHIWMIYQNYTTIEFCEKRRMKVHGYQASPFKKGCLENFKEALGNRIWAWPFPFLYREEEETGLVFSFSS